MALARTYDNQSGGPNVPVESRVFQVHPEATFYLGVIATPDVIHMPQEYQAYHRFRANVYVDEMHFLGPEARQKDGGETGICLL